MDKKWIILIIMIVVVNGVARLGWIPYDWERTYTIVANVAIIGWVIFTLMTPTKEKET